MSVKWDLPPDNGPGSIEFVGHQLRHHYPLDRRGVDRRMAELMVWLYSLPGVRSGGTMRP